MRFLTFFYFLERFLFFSGEILYPIKPAKILLNLLNYCIKRPLSDEFNMAAIKHSLMKRETSNVITHIKTVILQRNFSFGLFN